MEEMNENDNPKPASQEKIKNRAVSTDDSHRISGDSAQVNATHNFRKILFVTLAALLILVFLAITFVIGVMVNFSACYKDTCNPLESGAPFLLPIASLFISIPLARRLLRNA